MKVKVNEKVFNAISFWEEYYTIDELVNDFLFRREMNLRYFTATYECLNELRVYDMLNILKNGYELENSLK